MAQRVGLSVVRAVVVGVLVVGLVVVVDVGVASAAPTMTVTPTTMENGTVVSVDTSGFTTGAAYAAIGVCDRAWSDAPDDLLEFSSHCSLIDHDSPTMPSHLDFVVRDLVRPYSGAPSFLCSELPSGCAVVAVTTVESDPQGDWKVQDWVVRPITITPSNPTVMVTPTSIDSGGTVQVTTAGFPAGSTLRYGLCSAGATLETVNKCDFVTEAANAPTTTTLRLRSYFVSESHLQRCVDGCQLGVLAEVAAPGKDSTDVAFASAPLQIGAESLAATPRRALPATAAVTVTGTGLEPGSVSVAQCYQDDDGYWQSRCSSLTPLNIGPDWTVDQAVDVHAAIPTADGSLTSPCVDSCVLSFFLGGSERLSSLPLTFSPPTVDVEQYDQPAPDGGGVNAELSAFPGATATVVQCATPLGATIATSQCRTDAAQTVTLDDVGRGLATNLVVHNTITSGAQTVDCRAIECRIVGASADGTILGSHTVLIGEAKTLTLTPSTGLIVGDPIAVAARGLVPNAPYRLIHCDQVYPDPILSHCEPLANGKAVTADANGRIDSSVNAVEFFRSGNGQMVHCDCSVAVVRPSDSSVVLIAGSELASATVTASPDTGLADGASVTVTASDVQPTYAGPTLFLPTGGWSVSVCDPSIPWGAPSLVEVFQKCTLPAGGGVVNVLPHQTVVQTVQVQAHATATLGAPIDCTGPLGCVVGLVRWEQNGTVTVHFTRITFG